MILGIDIGGTNIGMGLVEDGRVIRSGSVKSFGPDFTQEQTLDYLAENIDGYMTPEVEGIGFGVPSLVNIKKGIVYDTANIPSWKEVHLKSFFENRYGCPVRINNDANCYALGAYVTLPEKERPESLVAITLGTGLGMGIVIGGKLFCGANCGAGELSSIPYRGQTIEDFTSKKFFKTFDRSPKELAEAALGGDEAAMKIFREFGEHIGYVMSVILYAYDPCAIVIGGGISNNYHLFRDPMFDYLRRNFPYQNTIDQVKIIIANDLIIPVIGAASLI